VKQVNLPDQLFANSLLPAIRTLRVAAIFAAFLTPYIRPANLKIPAYKSGLPITENSSGSKQAC
jgi:hypothetical protein